MQVEWLYSGDPWANSYVVGNILVDAGVMPMAVAPYKEQIETIVLTHCHFDHIARVKEIAHMCKAKVAIHKADARGLVDDVHSLSMHFGARSPGILPDITLAEGDTIGDFVVLHTPGHTPGCICLYSEKDRLLFCGDTVFADGYFGRYDFPGGSRAELARSLERLSALDVEGLFAGHGEPTEENGSRCIAAALGPDEERVWIRESTVSFSKTRPARSGSGRWGRSRSAGAGTSMWARRSAAGGLNGWNGTSPCPATGTSARNGTWTISRQIQLFSLRTHAPCSDGGAAGVPACRSPWRASTSRDSAAATAPAHPTFFTGAGTAGGDPEQPSGPSGLPPAPKPS